jgi:hypothetical protein
MEDELSAAIPSQQLAAVASPGRRIRDLVGSFGDVDGLIDSFSQPVAPRVTKKPGSAARIGSCPAAHNRALVGERRRKSA